MKTWKKRLLTLLATTLMMSLAVSCTTQPANNQGTQNTACASHIDEDEDGKCDICDATMQDPDDGDGEAESVSFSVTVKDQDGLAVAATLDFIPEDGGDAVLSLTANAQGIAQGNIPAGAYTVSFTALPDYHYGASAKVTIAEGTALNLTVENNTPNGSAERPFLLTEPTNSVTLPADATVYFSIPNANERTFVLENANVEVTCGETTYQPDQNGVIRFELYSEDSRAPIALTVKNKTSAALSISVILESKPGSGDNPHIVTATDTVITATVPKETIQYYKWTATETGLMMVTSNTPNNSIMLNRTEGFATIVEGTGGSACTYLYVKSGDVISIHVASQSNADVSEVQFAVSIYTTTEAAPLLKDTSMIRFEAGLSYTFACAEAKTLTVESASAKVTVNGTEYTPEGGVITVALEAGQAFTVTNTSDQKQEITLKLANA